MKLSSIFWVIYFTLLAYMGENSHGNAAVSLVNYATLSVVPRPNGIKNSFLKKLNKGTKPPVKNNNKRTYTLRNGIIVWDKTGSGVSDISKLKISTTTSKATEATKTTTTSTTTTTTEKPKILEQFEKVSQVPPKRKLSHQINKMRWWKPTTVQTTEQPTTEIIQISTTTKKSPQKINKMKWWKATTQSTTTTEQPSTKQAQIIPAKKKQEISKMKWWKATSTIPTTTTTSTTESPKPIQLQVTSKLSKKQKKTQQIAQMKLEQNLATKKKILKSSTKFKPQFTNLNNNNFNSWNNIGQQSRRMSRSRYNKEKNMNPMPIQNFPLGQSQYFSPQLISRPSLDYNRLLFPPNYYYPQANPQFGRPFYNLG